MLAKDQAQLEGAQRDLRRFSDLIGKGATTQVNVDNAKTQADILIGTIKADQSALDNLKVQKSFTIIRAPFSGRISAASMKIGNFVRPADTAPLAVAEGLSGDEDVVVDGQLLVSDGSRVESRAHKAGA
jgi:multidrug efflux pump subunit AcrA (membrane-fusion protein)